MRKYFFPLVFLSGLGLNGQTPIYNYVAINKTLEVPKNLSSQRSVVIYSVPNKIGDFVEIGDPKKMLEQVHKGFITMGIDAIIYVSDINLTASNNAKLSYVNLFNKRRVKNVIFITKNESSFEIVMAPFDGTSRFIFPKSNVFYLKENDLYSLLLKTGKEIRRADQKRENFLIPEKPNYLNGISIVENTLLKNYPGILRRSKLAVERFTKLDTTDIYEEEVLRNIRIYNAEIENKNIELEKLMESYPYAYELIDPMTDDELKRKRYQFLLRSVHASAKVAKQMLDYEVRSSETSFASVIPIMPDGSRVKTIPKNALVYKFYIRQNISKNVHVGVWDADVTWQKALVNMIGNLTQKLSVSH